MKILHHCLMEISEAARTAAIAGHLSVMPNKKAAPEGAALET
jgi:hypothetical protein